MQELKIGKHTLKVYTDIDELPSWRFSKFNKYVLIDAYTGSTIEQIDERFQNLYLMAKHEETAKMKNEINNLRQAIYFVLTEVDTSMMAFITLIHSMNGQEVTDLSEDGVKRIQEQLRDSKARSIRDLVLRVKKK